METASEFLIRKGFRKVYQIDKRYNLTIGEMVEFLNEYANRTFKDLLSLPKEKGNSNQMSFEFDK